VLMVEVNNAELADHVLAWLRELVR
jgi:hypothetical protein